MDWDEPVKKAGAGVAVGDNLAALGVAELETRIAALKAEIDRTVDELAKKKAQAAAAEGLFKS